jgi:CheY-like chemotaxis protein
MVVLVVDDESLVRRSLKRALEQRGHEVFEASDGLQAIKIWPEIKPALVFLDVLMPGLTGPEVLRELDKKKNGAKVILISAYSGDYNLETAQKMGADLFCPKPFEDIFSIVKLGEDLVK